MTEKLHEDPFDDPLWKAADKAARRPRRHRSKAFIGCPMSWLKWVLPLCGSAEQLAVAQCLYRLRIVQRSKTIRVSNRELKEALGISRYSKYRLLTKLENAGVILIRKRDGRSVVVTLLR